MNAKKLIESYFLSTEKIETTSETIEKIMDDYAIKFVKWLLHQNIDKDIAGMLKKFKNVT